MKVKLEIRGVERWQAYLKQLPRGVVKVALQAIAEWVLGDGTRGLKHYQPYKYVTRRRAYGKTFVSDKQRRYVMAAIRDGRIDPGAPHRTGRTQRAWKIITGGGYKISIQNPTLGAYYTRHDSGQARLNALAGWRKTAAIVQSNIAGAIRAANAAIKPLLKGP